jgi:hypothetical protein
MEIMRQAAGIVMDKQQILARVGNAAFYTWRFFRVIKRGSRVLWALGPMLSFGWLAIPARRWGYDTWWMDDADRNTAETSCSHVILSFGES